ncbi:MAG: hypothetical protein ACLTNY_00195 [Blautia massiliensis (ex Durand et al. 2017)]
MRCRHGDGYANSDIDRLNMQRYFYAGLFKRAAHGRYRYLNQLPLGSRTISRRIWTFPPLQSWWCLSLKLDSSNIILAQTPVFMGVPNVGKTDTFAGLLLRGADAGSIANLLNGISAPTPAPLM